MLDVSAVVKQKASPASESAPVVSALRIEFARRKLMSALLSDARVAGYIAKQLLIDLNTSNDYSEILLVKHSGDLKQLLDRFILELAELDPFFNQFRFGCNPSDSCNVVREGNFVQLANPVTIETLKVSMVVRRMMYDLRFLPAYLIALTERLQNQLELAPDANSVYKAMLLHTRLELKRLRQEMIASNTGLVAFVAHKHKTTSLSFDDLMQEGTVGLIKAVDRFDPERGTCFSTYAIFWIKQAISRLIVKQDKIVPLPVALAEKSSPVFEAMRRAFLQNERWPSVAELGVCCDLSEQELKIISSYYQSTYILDEGADGDGMSLMEKMHQQQFIQPLDQLIEADLISHMNRVVSTLPEKQADILAMRFGLKNNTEMTLQAIADHLHVTRERVRQIQNEALNKLKQQFGFDLMPFLEPKDS